ncbi:MAG TPA: ABC transporter permease [Acidimicrobiia bacterium]|nr:ABC transporter permease [Acidimicrobiia bacterium]
MSDVLAWFLDAAHWQGPTGIPVRLWEHLWISGLSVLAATAIGLPVGLYTGHTGRWGSLAINVANIGRAIPSYAILVMVLPVSLALAPTFGYSPNLGLSFIPTFTAMVLLAVPPILVNAHAGLRSVDPDLVDAARAMGLKEGEILRNVELPLASSVIVGGFRTAVLNVIATATIGAIVSFGGLGRFIIDGRLRGVAGIPELVGGAIIVTVLAVGVDMALGALQRRMTPAGVRMAIGQVTEASAPA